MHLSILEVGRPPAEIAEDWPRYPETFDELLRPHMPDLKTSSIAVDEGEDLPEPGDADGFLITGSKAGVYDDLPWIDPLLAFIQKAHRTEKPLIGICFGHQAIAHALGGHAAKSAAGWGVGVHRYQVDRRPDWMEPMTDSFRLNGFHQDQVERLPEGATVFASSPFCAYAGFEIGSAFCVQGHPEFSAAYERALLDLRRQLIGEANYTRAVASLSQDTEADLIAQWIARFLDQRLHP
ncbi:MAG: gamma-glutamyl-gamma-aminobutyrate hydrolase family protein [Geminicoccaceae bacterium]